MLIFLFLGYFWREDGLVQLVRPYYGLVSPNITIKLTNTSQGGPLGQMSQNRFSKFLELYHISPSYKFSPGNTILQ